MSIEKEKNSEIAAILSRVTDGFYGLDTQWRFTFLNTESERYFGQPSQALLGQVLWDLFPNIKETALENHLRQAIDEQTTVHFEAVSPFSDHWLDTYIYPSSSGLTVTFRDISEYKYAVETLEETNGQLRMMVESITDYAVISLDRKGNITSWNPGAEYIFGYEKDEVLGRYFDFFFTPEDQRHGLPQQKMNTAIRTGRAIDEGWRQRKNGKRFFGSGVMSTIYDHNQTILGFTKVTRDVTFQKEAETLMMEARHIAEAASAAKSEFLANMSHEIRTPMNAIIGLTNLLSSSQPLTVKQTSFIQTLQTSADSLLMLINDLLDISKIEARTIELEHIPFRLDQILKEILSMLAVRAKEKGLYIYLEDHAIQHQIFIGDPSRLRQIILNLCTNALKFTEQGEINIKIQCIPTETLALKKVCIYVEDTGIGIAPDKLDSIFEKFVQGNSSINRKYGGTGLGLAITKTLAETMGGTITVESTLGKGSTFELCIPLALSDRKDIAGDPEIACDWHQTDEQPIPQDKPQHAILLVEDYAPNVMVAGAFLEEFGYTYEVASNGEEAIDRVKGGQYLAVLMDIQMAKMDGLEATRQIRNYEQHAGRPRIPIIGMTAHALSGDRERCLNAGMDDYLSKPFRPDELWQKIAQFNPA